MILGTVAIAPISPSLTLYTLSHAEEVLRISASRMITLEYGTVMHSRIEDIAGSVKVESPQIRTFYHNITRRRFLPASARYLNILKTTLKLQRWKFARI